MSETTKIKENFIYVCIVSCKKSMMTIHNSIFCYKISIHQKHKSLNVIISAFLFSSKFLQLYLPNCVMVVFLKTLINKLVCLSSINGIKIYPRSYLFPSSSFKKSKISFNRSSLFSYFIRKFFHNVFLFYFE